MNRQRSNFKETLDNLWVDAQLIIIEGVRKHGEESKNYPNKVIKLPNELQYNFEPSTRFAIEVHEEGFYSACGNIYPFGSWNHEQLTELADYIVSLDK